MCTSLNQLMRIALLLTAIDAALVLFPVTAHAGSNFRRAIDAGVVGAKKVAVLVNIDKTNQQMTVSLDGVSEYRLQAAVEKEALLFGIGVACQVVSRNDAEQALFRHAQAFWTLSHDEFKNEAVTAIHQRFVDTANAPRDCSFWQATPEAGRQLRILITH
jgi:hypothetical protein